jgi:hypothetical protein
MKNNTSLRLVAYGVLAFIVLSWLVGASMPFLLGWLAPRLYLLFWAGLLAVHVLFALGIMRDATAQQEAGSRPYFVEPAVWGLATLIGGFPVIIVYWAFHYSTLRRF